MKASRQCPKCRSNDIRFETLAINVLVTPLRTLHVYRNYDSYVCGGCGFSEFYRRP